VIPLTLKVNNVVVLVADKPEVNRQVQYYLDKVERLDDKPLIPEKFHLLTSDIDCGCFRYDLSLSFTTSSPTLPFSQKFSELVEDLVEKGMEKDQFDVVWFVYSPERLSKYKLECLVKQYGEVFHPEGYSVLLSFQMVGVWRGIR